MPRRDQHCDLPRLQIECALVVLGARRGGADVGAGGFRPAHGSRRDYEFAMHRLVAALRSSNAPLARNEKYAIELSEPLDSWLAARHDGGGAPRSLV
jgi:hypothetical protein